MRKHHLARRWRRATLRTHNLRLDRVHHADRLSDDYLPESSHVQRGLR